MKSNSQNLVPNPSFEDTLGCPQGFGQINKANGWSSYAASPDYFNSCGNFDFDVFGYQMPSSGSAYAGFANYVSNALYPDPNYREYLGRALTSPLTINTKYYISFKVNLTIFASVPSNCGSNKMGAMFSSVPYSSANPAPINNNPPVYSNSIITDTLNWTTIFGSFVADSAYQYLIIGNFFDNNNTDTLLLTSDTVCSSYYYVDDICVSTDSAYCVNYATGLSELQDKPSILVFPNPAHNSINISFPLLQNYYDIVIYDSFGQIFFLEQYITSKHKSINISDAQYGLLIIKILYNNQSFHYKLLKL